MSALLHRIARSRFADDLNAMAVAIVLTVVMLAGVGLGMAVDDLSVVTDPTTGLAVVVDTEPGR